MILNKTNGEKTDVDLNGNTRELYTMWAVTIFVYSRIMWAVILQQARMLEKRKKQSGPRITGDNGFYKRAENPTVLSVRRVFDSENVTAEWGSQPGKGRGGVLRNDDWTE